ncbi:putative periplasmic serine endoprotease DegP-like precursor [Anatilimnocola aggregata]|uniref:Putative periplasmic serine endoprotease DegP-like n=2 Tax=Anatilimnocola aggregata TaxID=2528021 RepID=A0A517YJK0_9BACT|nr:putative periplasmic serine endoprotease DegP-like precursor [Anatilimnocola aggregata]
MGANANAPSREPQGYLISRTPHASVARIVVPDKTGVSFGSGSLVDVRGEHGLLVTNWHVVRDASGPIYVFFADGFQTPATVVKTDRDWDLAALSIRKPPASQPLKLSTTAPQPGEWLCIAGYGSGDYRAAAGRCTQYVSPAQHLPYEMVEVAAEARQGDSGGPIFNERGEIAGVLFGSGKGSTSGSYAGRVANFLQGVVPVAPPAIAAAPSAIVPTPNAPNETNDPPAADAHLFAAATQTDTDNDGQWQPRQQAPESHSSSPALAVQAGPPPPPRPEVAIVDRPGAPPRPLMPLPDRRAEPLTLVNGEEPLEDRTALRPTPTNRDVPLLDGRDLAAAERHNGPIAAEALNVIHTPLPSRIPVSSPLETAPADQLIAAAWKQVGGNTLWDQGKTALAGLGLLGLLYQFWRLNSRPDAVGDDD